MRQVVPLLLTLSAAAPSFAAICGTNFGSSTTGLTVTVGVMAVDVLFVSPTQIEAELPFGLATGPATLTVAAGAASPTHST